MKRTLCIPAACVLCLVLQPAAWAAHVDIMPYFVGRTNPTNYTQVPTELKTGSADYDAPLLNPDDRVFTGTALNYAVGPGWVSTIRTCGITRVAHRSPKDRRRSWALANFTRPRWSVFTATPAVLVRLAWPC